MFRRAQICAISMLCLLSSIVTHAQQAWTLLPESNTTNSIVRGVFAIDNGLGITGPIFRVGVFGSISKSTDSGITWTNLTSGTSAELNDVYFVDQFSGWVVGNGIILRTTNGGTSWTATSFPGIIFRSIHQYAANQTLWAAGLDGVIYRSTNQGVNWTAVNSNTTANLNDILAYTPTTIIAVGANGTITRSTDGGSTWTATTVGSITLNGVDGFLTTAVIAVGNSGTVLRSATAGQSWSTITSSGTSVDLNDVTLTGGSNFIAVGNAGTILRTTNGGTGWSIIPTGNDESLRAITKRTEAASLVRFWISGFWGMLTSDTQITSCAAPQASLVSPVSITRCVGESVTLEAFHTGTVGKRVWKRNGIGGNDIQPSKLMLTNLQTSNSGLYTMEVSGPCGTVTTAAITLTVNTPQQPSSIVGTGLASQNVATTYSVSSIPGATFNWSPGSGGTVTGTGNEVQISWSAAGSKTISVTATDACGTSIARTASVSVLTCTTPAQPSVITLTSGSECTNSSATYSVTAVAGVTYSWSVSTGGTITGSGNSATVVWNTTSGSRTITVTPSNACGNGTARMLSVTVGLAPVQPSVISGNATVCTGVSTAYSVTNVTGTTYTWDTGGAGTITGSGNAINVTWTSSGAKTLTVTPTNSCGAGSARTLSITVNAVPAQPGVIAGANTVSTGASSQYSISAEAGVTYTWAGGTGATVTGSGNAVSISWSSAGSKTITVTPSNGCGSGTARTLAVTVSDCAVPAQPSVITGNASGCIGSGSVYSVTAVGGVNYNWNAGVDGSVVGSGNSVTLSWSSAGTKVVTVTPFNACGPGTVRTMNVVVSGVPAQPSAITGTTTACKDAATTYSVTNVAGVTYTWNTGGRGTVTGSGNNVSIAWNYAGNQVLQVIPSNSCGNGQPQTINVTVNKTPDPVSEITGNLSGCINIANAYSVTNVSGVTYNWAGGASSTSSSTSNSSNITWTTTGTKTLTVTPTNSCGSGLSSSLTVNINEPPVQTSVITGSATAIAGVPQTYSVTNVANVSYQWNAGTGGSVAGVGNSVSITWATGGSKTVTVTPFNATCGLGTPRTVNVTVTAPCTVPTAPTSVSPSTPGIPVGTQLLFTVTGDLTGVSSLNWSSSPNGGAIFDIFSLNQARISWSTPGVYQVSVAAVNACGQSTSVSTTVVVCTPSVAAAPTGLANVTENCSDNVVRYTINTQPGMIYEWGNPTFSGTILSPIENNFLDIKWFNSSSEYPATVRVRSRDACNRYSAYATLDVTIKPKPQYRTITNDLVGGFCDGKVVTWTISSPEVGTTYTWVSDRPATISGASNHIIQATINGPMNIQLYGSNTCATNLSLGGITGNPLPVPTTAPGLISGPATIETGQLAKYTTPNEGLPFSYDWNYGIGNINTGSVNSIDALFGTTGEKIVSVRYASNGACGPVYGPARTLPVTAVAPCVAPSTPTAVTRLHSGSICRDVAYAFSVPFVQGVSYNWVAGADATITGTGNEVMIKWSSAGSKNVTASYTNACGTSSTQQTSVVVTLPPDALSITGNNTACQASAEAFSVSSVGGISYIWDVPGATFSGQGTNSITVSSWPNAGINTVKFRPSNTCGTGVETTLNVTVNAIPAQPSVISGDVELCVGTAKTYSVGNVSGATYTWDAGANATVTGTGNSRTISWSTTGTKTLQVTASNGCGTSVARLINPIVIAVPSQPSAITGTASPTIGASVDYVVTNVAGVNYAWSLSDKGVISSTGNLASVLWNATGSATLSVTPSNACGNGAARTASITVSKIAQTISFTLPSPVLTTDFIELNGVSSSGLPVAYTSSNPALVEVLGNTLILKGSGSVNITALQAGDAIFAAATSVVRALTVNKAAQAINFDALPARTFGEGSFVLEGVSNVGLPLTYTSSNVSVATVSGSTVTIVGAGATNITATQGGDAIFNAATPIVRALTVNKADQLIEFEPLAAKGVSDPPFSLTATASSGLAVSYASSNPAVATVSGSTVTIVGQGTTTITASQTGNSNFNAATPVPQPFTVNSKQSQTITFSVLPNKTFGDASFTISASASSGLPVAFTSANPLVATVSGNTVTIIGAGTTLITASQPGDAVFNAATNVSQTLLVNKAAQTITFGGLESKRITDGTFTLTATASSGLAVSYTSSNTAVATISGNTVTLVGAGTTTITASQGGNTNYEAASAVEQTLVVTDKQAQTITFGVLTAKTFGDVPFDLSATASSGLVISYASSNPNVATISGNTVTIVGAGTTNITASQAGDAVYNAATNVSQTLLVNKAAQTITFSGLESKRIADGTFTLTATASSGLAVSYTSSNTAVATISGNTVTLVGAGTTTITASQGGSTNYEAASPVEQTLVVTDKQAQTITFGALTAKTFGDGPFDLSATASSGLVVSYTSSNPNVATISGNTLTIVGAGTSIITASQSGNGNFDGATPVEQTLTVNKATQSISFAALPNWGITQGSLTLSATTTSGLAVTYASSNPGVAIVSGNIVTPVSPGTTTITATQAGNANFNAATDVQRVLTIVDDTPKRVIRVTGNLSFGDVVLPETASRSVVVENRGDNALSISAIRLPEGFTADRNTGTIAPGASLSVAITFAPTQAREYSGRLEITSNATSGDGFLNVSGKGVTITGVEETAVRNPLVAYPNPGTGIYVLEVRGIQSNDLWVTDTTGKTVLQSSLLPLGNDRYQVDIREVRQGLYFLRLTTDGQVRMVRVIKMD